MNTITVVLEEQPDGHVIMRTEPRETLSVILAKAAHLEDLSLIEIALINFMVELRRHGK
jgi:hypothetical protein